jgi:predicted phage-related endonuclease
MRGERVIEIGSSEAAVIMGVSPHSTPFQLWARRVGLIKDETVETEIMSWGTALQDAVLDKFVDDPSQIYFTQQVYRRAPFRATLDGEWTTGEGAHHFAEIKCVIGHPPTSPRVEWVVQCLHQRVAVNAPETVCHLVCYGNLHMESWLIPHHQAAMDRILREEERFLEMIEKQTPPPVRAADASILHKAWPFTRKELVKLDAAVSEAAREWERWSQAAAEAQKTADGFRATIQAAMGEVEEAITTDSVRYSWKQYERKAYEVKAATYRQFKRMGGKG